MILPEIILTVLQPFAIIFCTKKTWIKACTLFTGALLCKGGRTIASILTVLGMQGEKRFEKYHRFLNQNAWDSFKAAKILLHQLLPPSEETVYIAVDEHIERRRGKKIKALGCYRDPVKSSQGYLVKTFGLKWISMMVLRDYTWFSRTLALPFFTVLATPKKADKAKQKKHRTTIDLVCKMCMAVSRWLKGRKVCLIGDGAFACGKLAQVCCDLNFNLISRLRMDARLFQIAPERKGRGRPRIKGSRLESPKAMLKAEETLWETCNVIAYSGVELSLKILSFVCLWQPVGSAPILVRVVITKDPTGGLKPAALISLDPKLGPETIIQSFMKRWNQEVTFRECRDYLGVETQRQWSDKAIQRSTPCLFALYSFTVLCVEKAKLTKQQFIKRSSWYNKENLTFSDLLTALKTHLWQEMNFNKIASLLEDTQKSVADFLQSIIKLMTAA